MEDRSSPPFFGGVTKRLIVGGPKAIEKKDYPIGVLDVSAPDRKTPVFRVYLWSRFRGRPVEQYFKLEASRDGKTFETIPMQLYLTAPNVYDTFDLEPLNPLAQDIRYVRPVIGVPEPQYCWAASYSGAQFKPSENRLLKIGKFGVPPSYGMDMTKFFPELKRETISTYIGEDHSQMHFFPGNIPHRLKIEASMEPGVGPHVVGVIDIREPSKRNFGIRVYRWTNRSNRALTDYFQLETSTDGVAFTPVPVTFALIEAGRYDLFEMRTQSPVAPAVQYIRVSLKCPEPKNAWIAQYAGIQFHKPEDVVAPPPAGIDLTKFFPELKRETISTYIVEDHSQMHFFPGNIPHRLMVDATKNPDKGPHVVGVIDIREPSKRNFGIRVYRWTNRSNRALTDYFQLETSADGVAFTPVPVTFTLIEAGRYDLFEMRPQTPVAASVQYIRVSLKCPEPKYAWIAQYAGIQFNTP